MASKTVSRIVKNIFSKLNLGFLASTLLFQGFQHILTLEVSPTTWKTIELIEILTKHLPMAIKYHATPLQVKTNSNFIKQVDPLNPYFQVSLHAPEKHVQNIWRMVEKSGIREIPNIKIYSAMDIPKLVSKPLEENVKGISRWNFNLDDFEVKIGD